MHCSSFRGTVAYAMILESEVRARGYADIALHSGECRDTTHDDDGEIYSPIYGVLAM